MTYVPPDPRDPECMCGHQGPNGKGMHTGAPWCEPLKKNTCVHPDCLAQRFGPCKGFCNIAGAMGFLMDERLGGP